MDDLFLTSQWREACAMAIQTTLASGRRVAVCFTDPETSTTTTLVASRLNWRLYDANGAMTYDGFPPYLDDLAHAVYLTHRHYLTRPLCLETRDHQWRALTVKSTQTPPPQPEPARSWRSTLTSLTGMGWHGTKMKPSADSATEPPGTADA